MSRGSVQRVIAVTCAVQVSPVSGSMTRTSSPGTKLLQDSQPSPPVADVPPAPPSADRF
ncbi:hypothetical protein [Actinoplanes sp. NPDC051851]|uniref:hypothetical protein n=1 Tax=Actinoplanes sp. NPDC051851 TaxID=3154753 RepID=UPI00341ECF55